MRAHTVVPFLVACMGIAAFCAMDALMKELSIALGVYNAMLWRMGAGSVLGGAAFLARRADWPSRAGLALHIRRSLVATVMALAFFYGIVRVPLAEGIAITFIAPLIALYLAALLLGEQISMAAIVASLLGLLGMLVIVAGKLSLDPTVEAMKGIAALLGSAVLYGYNLILQRRQAQVAAPIEIAFFQNLLVMGFLALAAPWLAQWPGAAHLPFILGSAALALIALVLLAWAYARAEAQVLLPVEYTAFVWAAILGAFMFDESLTLATVIGTLLIVIGCLLSNWRRRTRPATLR